ncbi:uncharacterized protein LOC117334926 [Pecten maximus]|uniref:uncharacterized protein LOC117334926 n=1 Tax=Pecten maximus TaxID=6579 RepID=UPI0014584CAC|nr:uncharacterized protein LOC117334926 [Pecten maximus]
MAENEFGKNDDKYFFPDLLSLAYFSHISMYMLTSTCDYYIKISSPGMSVDYKTGMGTITINGEQKAQEVKCKMGDHLELRVLQQMVEGSLGEVLEVRKNDVTLVSTRFVYRSARVTCTRRPPSKMLVFTHKLMAMEYIQKTQNLDKGQKGQAKIEKGEDEVFKCCGPFPDQLYPSTIDNYIPTIDNSIPLLLTNYIPLPLTNYIPLPLTTISLPLTTLSLYY